MASPIGVRVLSVASLVLCASSCGSGGDGNLLGSGGGFICAGFSSKLQSCGLVRSGANFKCEEPADEQERCYASCSLDASCSDLEQVVCGGNSSSSLERCTSKCSAFTCKSGETVNYSYRCDGDRDCDDGSDESGCETFTCKSGETVKASERCDGSHDCDDGSDEAGCPTFTCKNGETIQASYRCDGGTDCYDGSDEDGCPDSIDDVLLCK